MRISDWSSDVCSSDLTSASHQAASSPPPTLIRRGISTQYIARGSTHVTAQLGTRCSGGRRQRHTMAEANGASPRAEDWKAQDAAEIGRAAGRAREGQYV